MSGRLTETERMFLRVLSKLDPAPTWSLPASNRQSDRARQRLKRRGLVIYSSERPPPNYTRWRITEAGLRALATQENDNADA